MNKDFITALDQLESEKNISKEDLIQAIEASITSAYKKNYKEAQDVEVTIDRETGEITVYETKIVVDEVQDPHKEISLIKAKEINPAYEIDDLVKIPSNPKDFGRIAAQNAKQLIMQKILEAERNKLYEVFSKRLKENINGIVTRTNRGNVYIDLDSVDAILPQNEQIPNETYERGDRIKVFLNSVKNTPKGVQLRVSRTNPDFIKRLFEEEIPEFIDGGLDIKSIARDPGFRTKVAVVSNNPRLDIIGTCIGRKGSRIQNILNEIGNEKIDIVVYSKDINEYLRSALSPAKVKKIITNPDKKTAIVIVDQDQLALAIGKEGKNVQLTAKLTGWKVDIKSQDQYNELLNKNPDFEEEYTNPKKLTQSEKKIKEILEDDLFVEDEIKDNSDNDDDLFSEEKIKELFE